MVTIERFLFPKMVVKLLAHVVFVFPFLFSNVWNLHLFDISRALFIEKNICRDTLELLRAGDRIDPRFYVFSLQ